MFEALRGLAGGGWSLLGQPSSVFLANPPLMNFIQAVPLLVWRSPWAVVIFIVTLNALAILCVYRAARQLLNQPAAYIAAALFAINPWIVLYSRMTWVQSLVPLLVTLIACLLWPILANAQRSGWALVIAALALTALTQTYIQAWGLLVSIGLLLILFRASIPRRPFWISLGIFAVATGVYGLGLAMNWEAAQTQLANFASDDAVRITADGINHAVRLVTGLDFHAQYSQLDTGPGGLPAASQVVYAVLALALAGGIFLAVRAIIRRSRDWRAGVILLVWFFVPVLLMTIVSHPVHPHYLLLSIPAGSVLAAWSLSLLARHSIGRLAALGILIGCALVFGMNLFAYNADSGRHPTAARWDGWTLEAGTQVGDAIRQLMDGAPTPWRVAADARASLVGALSGQYVQTLSGLDYPNFVVLPGKEALSYLLFNKSIVPDALGSRADVSGAQTLQFADNTQAAVIRVMPYDRSAALALPETKVDWPSTADLTLLGYTLNSTIEPGRPITLTTYWRVDALHPERAEWYIGSFYQAFDQDGQFVVQADGHSQWARRWQEGDVYVERVRIDLPGEVKPGDYQLRVGLLDSIHEQAYEFLLPDGRRESYEIPLTVVEPPSTSG